MAPVNLTAMAFIALGSGYFYNLEIGHQGKVMRRSIRSGAVVILALVALSACGGQEPEATESAATNIARVTEVAQALAQSETDTPRPSPTVIPSTATPEPTFTLTATPLPPLIQVSENTNCRSGPDPNFAFLGVLSVGQEAEVVARADESDYWYIVNPDNQDEFCWLWGEYATVEGDASSLPVLTPEPTPTPYIGFDLWFHGFEPCGGSQTAIFAIRNAGAVRIWSGYVAAYAMNPEDDLYGPAKERHPFADRPLPACPPGHGNELYPGEVRYIHIPLSNVPHGRDAYAEITLCSADHAGGDCVTKIGYFYIP
jgi:hypothetical protein